MIKKLLFAGVLALAYHSSNAQVTIFEDSFETYTDFAVAGIGEWTMTDLDMKKSYGIQNVTFPNGSATLKAFQVFNKTKTTPALVPEQFGARTGDKQMICWNISEAPLKNNDWMISPKMTLGVDNNKLSFWAKPGHEDYGNEKFNVLVSTTNTTTTSFVKLNPTLIVTDSVVEWVEYTFDLDAYKGQDVYIAIQCVSDDQFALQIDDFKVTASAKLATNEVSQKALSIYPNPTSDVLNINTKSKVSSVEVYNMIGAKVSNATLVDGKVDVKGLSKGAYVIKVTTDAGTTSHKFIKN